MPDKEKSERKSSDKAKVVDFNDESLRDVHEGKGEYPENIHVPGPYGTAQVDVGNMQAVEGGTVTPGGMATGTATGDDGNTGSTAGGATRGGANDR